VNLRKDHYHTSIKNKGSSSNWRSFVSRESLFFLGCWNPGWLVLLQVRLLTHLFLHSNEWLIWRGTHHKHKPSNAYGWAVNESNEKHFQQRMSWLPQRWRTQRNAIRLANCITKWVIKTLNAPCAPLWGAYLLEYLFSPTTYPSGVDCVDCSQGQIEM